MLLTGKSKNPERWIATDAGMDKISTKIAGKIAGSLEKRLKKAYPKARKIEELMPSNCFLSFNNDQQPDWL